MDPLLAIIATLVAPLATVVGGVFAFLRWLDQRNRELEERRFERYWKLFEVTQESPHTAKQRVALLLMKKFPEYKEATSAFLVAAKREGSPWLKQNAETVDEVLSCFRAKR